MQQWQKYLAEVFGTFILVLIGTMAIVAIGRTGDTVMAVVPLAFAVALLAGLYAFGEVSGGHFNPAVTLAMFVDRRVTFVDLIGYWIAQVAGGLLGSLTLLWMTNQAAVESTSSTFSDGIGTAWISEVVLTAIFVAVILQVTRSAGMSNQAFIAIPLTLAGIHYAGIPFSGASVNPARSIAPAFVGNGDQALRELWVYLLAPLVGALVGWVIWKVVVQGDTDLRDDLSAIKDAAKA
ncbi:MAG: aquaporin [Acidimicrobiia bacterium]|nr:aquaporin [Acidimicrobiia bacterium]